MTAHPAFTRPRPALAPILFPAGDDALPRMLDERYDAIQLAIRCVAKGSIPVRSRVAQSKWVRRLNARIAQVAK